MLLFKGMHFLSVDQFQYAEEIISICALAKRLEVIVQRKKMTRILEGAILANLFLEPSTRTRLSFGAAFNLLGGAVRDTTGAASSSLVKGESIFDTARCVSGYADILVVRHPEKGSVAQFAESAKVPVINAGDGVGEHPTQALVDVYTILSEYAKDTMHLPEGFHITIVGDLKHGRTVHSLTKLLSLFKKVHFTFVSPPALKIPSSIVELVLARGGKVTETQSLQEAAGTSDVIYMTRIQEERFADQASFLAYAGQYTIDRAFYEQYCVKRPILMHPLPRDSRLSSPEINEDLNQHPKLAIFRQSDNGVAMRMALFCLILGVEEKVFETLQDVSWSVGLRSEP